MSDTADRIRAAVQGVTGLPDALAQPMRQLGQALAQIGSLTADPTNEPTKENKAMSNDIDKSVNRLNVAEAIRRQAIALQKHISEALADLQTLSGSEDIQISHALTMATIQASKALKQAHLMQDTADMLDQADQRDEENKISRMLISKMAQQGE